MKRIHIIYIIIIICLLSGCENNNNEVKKNTEIVIETSEVETEEIEQNVETRIVINTLDDFSDERAWIKYQIIENELETDYIGCINKEGIVLFHYLFDEIKQYTKFENGSAYVEFTNGMMKIIDRDGNEIISLKEEEIGNFQFSGDGYYCFIRQYSGFDKVGTVSIIIDSTGNLIYEGESGFTEYCGNDIFVKFNPLNGTKYIYYNIKDNIYFECDDVSSNNYSRTFDNGFSVIKLGANNRMLETRYAIINNIGDIKEILGVEGVYERTVGEVKNGAVVFEYSRFSPNGSSPINMLGYYDITNNNFVYMEKYLDKMYSEYFSSSNLCFSDDRIVIPLIGEDNHIYISIFDKQWNEILEPTKFLGDNYKCQYSCNRLVIDFGDGDVVLDENGKIIVEASKCGYPFIRPYSNNVANVGGKYIDQMGNLLFEEIQIK